MSARESHGEDDPENDSRFRCFFFLSWSSLVIR